MNPFVILSALILALFGSACSISPKAPATQSFLSGDYSPVIDYLKAYLPVQVNKHKFTGLSVALVDDQKIVWSEGFGFADKAGDRRATRSTAYRAGSVSKLFTAMAVMKLQEEQKVDLDASIKASVPEFDLKTRFGSIDGITLRNILSHHAGIPGNFLDGMWTTEPDSFKTVSSKLNRYYAAYPPNTVFAYSNAGYSVAGHAVENSSGIPFTHYISDSLLQPLDMTQSNFEFDGSGKNVAKSYWQGQEVRELDLRDIPAGGLVTTVSDLSQLVKLVNANGFYKSQLLTPESMQEMLSIQTYDSIYEPDGYNGIGWLHYSGLLDNKYTVVGHDGQTMAHSASVVIVPEIKLGVVLLANSPNLAGGFSEINDEILRLTHAVKTGKLLSAIPANEEKPIYGTEAGLNGQYVSSRSGGYISISPKSNDYTVNLGGEKLQLSANQEGGHSLSATTGLGDISFHAREVSGEKIIVSQESGRTTVAATPLITQARMPVWDARVGEYTIQNPIDTDIGFFKLDSAALAYENGHYQFRVKNPFGIQSLPIAVVNETEAILQGYGRGLGETIIVEPDGTVLHAGFIFKKSAG